MSTASVPNTFASAVTATGLQLDTNFNTVVAYINNPLNRNNWATDSGNTNTIVLTFSPAVAAYSAGLEITFKAGFTNTGGTVINANALGNKNFVTPDGSALAAGQVEANGIYKAAYNGSAFVYIGTNVIAASQAQMETATSAITFVSPSTTKYHPGVAKAWCYFSGTETGTISAISAYNVTNIVRNGIGDYTVNFASAFSSTAYVGVFFCRDTVISDPTGWGSPTVAPTVSAFRFNTGSSSGGAYTDVAFISGIFMGDQ